MPIPVGEGMAMDEPSCISLRFLFCNGSPVGAGIPMRDSANLELSFGSPVGGRIGYSCVGAIKVLMAVVVPLSVGFDWA